MKVEGPFSTGKGPFFWHGDLEVAGELTFRGPAMVTGTVRAGVVFDAGNASCVTIAGDLECQALFTDGDFAVEGTVAARDVVLGYYNDFSLIAHTIKARVVIEDDHHVEANIESPHHFDIDRYRQGHGEGVREALHAIFVDEVFDDEGTLDNRVLFARLSRGEPVFRGA